MCCHLVLGEDTVSCEIIGLYNQYVTGIVPCPAKTVPAMFCGPNIKPLFIFVLCEMNVHEHTEQFHLDCLTLLSRICGGRSQKKPQKQAKDTRMKM